jgi:high-affinity Fe2+/Pb2+ permease
MSVETRYQDASRRLAHGVVVIFVALVGLLVAWLLFGPLRRLANANEGFIAAIGVLVVVPLAIISNRLLERAHKKQLASAARNLLIHELGINLNFVGQIEESYHNNITDWFESGKEPSGLHIPHYGPRTNGGRCRD